MKISYSANHDTYTALGDEATRTAIVESFAPAFAGQVQVVPLARSASPAIFGRGNTACQLALVVTVDYGTKALALASVSTLRAALDGPLHLKVEQDATVLYFPNANCSSYAPQFRGLAVSHAIQWTTQDVTVTAPTVDPI